MDLRTAIFSLPPGLRRTATRLCGAFTCLAVGAGIGAGSAWGQTGPLTTSPAVPTPYQSPLFHAGGAPPPPPLTGYPDPLFQQLQGTPTGTVGGVQTQIPSFLLGAYVPGLPPIGAGAYYPEHFADGSLYSWEAPFSYVPIGQGTVTVDDADGANFTQTGFTQVLTTSTAGFTAAGTATGGEYYNLPPNTNGTATWTLTAISPGSYSVYFHIPDNLIDTGGTAAVRSSQVTYQIATTGANVYSATATVSQTEANSQQFLTGPFQLAAGDVVTVTLQRDATHNTFAADANLVADSMTLQTTIGDVQSAPTAINYESYSSDFNRAVYWGINATNSSFPTIVTPPPTANDFVTALAPPDYGVTTITPVFRRGFPDPAAPDPIRRIRQLVYFGRSEPTFVSSATLDDTATTGFTSSGGTTISDTSAINGTYKRFGATFVTATTPPTVGSPVATWTLTAPANGIYFATVHLPGNVQGTGRTAAADARVPDAFYTVTIPASGGNPARTKIVQISQVSGGDITLPTGGISLLTGQTVTITLNNGTTSTVTSPQVVADTMTISTGSSKGAIYCVDGFTGGVLWRYETPGSLNGPSAAVYSSPVVARVNVLIDPGDPTANPARQPQYDNRLVVIVGDNNGLVYCLDAIGNGDGTSNSAVIDPNTGQPNILPQPPYGPFTNTDGTGRPTTAPPMLDAAAIQAGTQTPHVGTTGVYWIYRPDSSQPRYQRTTPAAGTAPARTKGEVRLVTDRDASSELPAPGPFGTASPTVFIDPNVLAANPATTYAAPPDNAIIYVGNSNGVLYALNASGVPQTDPAAFTNPAAPATPQYGDTFNVSQDLRFDPTEPITPTPQPRWWFALRGGSTTSAASIESAPALHIRSVTNTLVMPNVTTYTPTVYIGSAHEQEANSNVGRLYALNGLLGPAGNSGKSDPTVINPAATNYGVPGSPNYNVDQRPKINATDTEDWSFPDAFGTVAANASKKPRPALGNITGSPVVFTNSGETTAARQTRIYIAANAGIEIPPGETTPDARPDATSTGRLWAVNLDGSVGTTTGSATGVWAYPSANDPNDATLDTVAEPSSPLGAFLHATPAIGFVQFPATILNGDGTAYTHADALRGDVKGNSVPMLYIATRGVNDTALYALDIDGLPDNPGNPIPPNDKLIYRVVSPDGSIFQSSPALVANSTLAGGNGGGVFATAGSSIYDFSATPISNPIPAQAYSLIRLNRAYTGFGPVSAPTLAATETTDLLNPAGQAALPAYLGGRVMTDWLYCGDSSTGLCRGITPNDSTYAGIPGAGNGVGGGLGGIVPTGANPPGTVDLTALIKTYLVDEAHSGSTKVADRLPVGATASLPVYEWGENVYIRFANVVPPVAPNGTITYVHDKGVDLTTASTTNPLIVYGNGGPINFKLSDDTEASQTNTAQAADSAIVPAALVTALPANGFIKASDMPADVNLVGSDNFPYLGAYTYAIGDGSAKRNTPGGRRRVLGATQVVHVYQTTDGTNFTDTGRTMTLAALATAGNVVTKNNADGTIDTSSLTVVQPTDQPTFGILNPIGVRGGSIPLPLDATTPVNALQVGDELGPFRGAAPPPLVGGGAGDPFTLQALTNGNDVYVGGAPPSSSGVGDPTKLRPLAENPPTRTRVVVTGTGLIAHNSSGDNGDVATGPAPTGTFTSTGNNGLIGSQFGSGDHPYALDLFDRSALSLINTTLKLRLGTASGGAGGSSLFWNDNTVNNSGHDSVVNFLPWETAPSGFKIGRANTSPDYPDISSQNVSATLFSDVTASDLTFGSADATPAALGTGTDAVRDRTVFANPVQVRVSIPHFQPPNQQLYKQFATGTGVTYSADPTHEITPFGIASKNDIVFPMGYVTTKRVFVPNRAGRYQDGSAYRDVRVYTGVPVNMATAITNPTTDIGKVPASFGIQTSQFAPLQGPLNPLFSPYNNQFAAHFQRLTVRNNGNVNLLNVHLDQKYYATDPNNPNAVVPAPLSLTADSLNPLSAIPAFDFGGITAPSASQSPFLARSSVDTDIVLPNPFIPANGLAGTYPAATFHKALPGSAVGSLLTVPDAPEATVPGASLDVSPDNRPTLAPDPNNNGLPFKAAPYLSLAVPFGTPVGTYSQTFRLFEGLDPIGYNTYTGTNYNPLYPPQYGGAVGGIGTPTGVNDVLLPGFHPTSTTGTILKATVLEGRMTDSYTFDALPQIDTVQAGQNAAGNAVSAPDFAPAAFRDPQTGRISAYFTSGRNHVPGSNTTVPYDIYGYNVNFASPAFMAGTGGQQWWMPINNNGGKIFDDTAPTATHSGLSVTLDQNGSSTSGYAFDTAVLGVPYANTLVCYPVNPATGVLSLPGQAITSDFGQIKYGARGLYATGAGYTNNLWAFWTTSTGGRTGISYNSRVAATDNSKWPQTTGALPIPAGLTGVSDPSPTLTYAPITDPTNGNTTLRATLEVTYSGTGAGGNTDLYLSRYQPAGTAAPDASKLVLIPFPAVTEILADVGGAFQSRDVAWSRANPINLAMRLPTATGTVTVALLYDNTGKPLFRQAVFDKASGQLVFTGISAAPTVSGSPLPLFQVPANATTVNAYIDLATGKVRFSAKPVPNSQLRATFSPLAQRITVDTRADTGATAFYDSAYKPNTTPVLDPLRADRRWFVWRKSAAGADTTSATLYYKTQRLTVFLPTPIGFNTATPPKPLVTVTVGGTDVTSYVDVDAVRGRIYFPLSANGTLTEGQPVTVKYTPAGSAASQTIDDTVQWQEEVRQNDNPAPADSAAALFAVSDNKVPLDTAVNENNVTAFLDPDALQNTATNAPIPHKVWLFWNSTRNGTADLYYETINPRFAPGP